MTEGKWNIVGKWYPEGSSAQSEAELTVEDGQFTLAVSEGKTYRGNIHTMKVSDRLGNVERKLTLDDGSIFTTPENDVIDAMFKRSGSMSGIIHSIESNMRWVVVSLLVTVVAAFSFFKWGVPWASEKIAHALPEQTNVMIADGTFKFLDKYIFEATKFDTAKQDAIRKHFMTTLVPYGSKEKSYKLHFRSWKMGDIDVPNAMALPSGDIIVTDKFIELSKNQQEIDSVLLHEMGHVERRHSLEMLIEGTFVTVATMLVIGDVNAFGDMGVGLGSALVSSNYSRGHESEADDYAFKKMLVAKIDPASFSQIMNRMTVYMEDEQQTRHEEVVAKVKAAKKGEGKDKDAKKEGAQKNAKAEIAEKNGKAEAKPKKLKKKVRSEGSIWDYLSSHPSTKKRVAIANQYSVCFKKGQTTCTIVVPKDEGWFKKAWF